MNISYKQIHVMCVYFNIILEHLHVYPLWERNSTPCHKINLCSISTIHLNEAVHCNTGIRYSSHLPCHVRTVITRTTFFRTPFQDISISSDGHWEILHFTLALIKQFLIIFIWLHNQQAHGSSVSTGSTQILQDRYTDYINCSAYSRNSVHVYIEDE